jgi:hypothetical protein
MEDHQLLHQSQSAVGLWRLLGRLVAEAAAKAPFVQLHLGVQARTALRARAGGDSAQLQQLQARNASYREPQAQIVLRKADGLIMGTAGLRAKVYGQRVRAA